MNLETLESDRIILRQLRIDDVDDIFEFTSKKEVTTFLSWDAHPNKKVTRSFINSVIENYDTDKPSQWGIELKKEKKIIGITGFILLDRENEKAEIAYLSSPFYGSKGYMTEANQMILSYVFDSLELNRIQAKAEQKNIASQKVLEKIGMIKEGEFEDFLKIKGTFRTYYYYSILRKNTQWK
jgi:ribosomal-protein-alanine N-acetyltransferase